MVNGRTRLTTQSCARSIPTQTAAGQILELRAAPADLRAHLCLSAAGRGEEKCGVKKERPDNRSGLKNFALENECGNNEMRILDADFSASHQFWGQRQNVIPLSTLSKFPASAIAPERAASQTEEIRASRVNRIAIER